MVGGLIVCLWQGWERYLLFLQSLRIAKTPDLPILVYNPNNINMLKVFIIIKINCYYDWVRFSISLVLGNTESLSRSI